MNRGMGGSTKYFYDREDAGRDDDCKWILLKGLGINRHISSLHLRLSIFVEESASMSSCM